MAATIVTLLALVAASVVVASRWSVATLRLASLVLAGISAVAITSMPGAQAQVQQYAWVEDLGLVITLRADALSLVMIALITGVGAAVLLFLSSYLQGPRAARLGALLIAFAAAMVMLVTTDDLLGLFMAWEATSVISYLLVGFNNEAESARLAARQALVTTAGGGLALLAGLVWLAELADTWRLSELVDSPPTGTAASLAVALVVIGALTKSAQMPFHGWLPRAMAAPTPVSAYLHSATMVKAGVYLVARLSPGFAAIPGFQGLVWTAGSASLILGGLMAIRQTDLKRLLAYSTIAQLGLLMIVFALGTDKAIAAGIAMLVAHGLAKSALFLTVGVIEHRHGSRSLPQVGGLWRTSPWVALAAVAAAASMSGLPPAVGFATKEAGFGALTKGGAPWWLLAAATMGAALTVGYAARAVVRPVSAPSPGPLNQVPAAMRTAPTILGLLTLGLAMNLGWFGSAVAESAGTPGAAPLVWWPGVNMALGLSVVAITSGTIVAWRVARTDRAVRPSRPHFDVGVERVFAVAGRVTARVQSGSLPTYLMVTLAVAVLLPGAVLARAAWPADASVEILPNSTLEVAAAVATIVAAIGVVRARRRFAAVLLLGAAGYGMAGIFVARGAPDLALTQIVVETVTLLAFALVLGRVPAVAQPATSRARKLLRAGLAAATGTVVAASALLLTRTPTPSDVSDRLIAEAGPTAGAANVVNAILTDFRAIDTLVEVLVVAVAALGIAALARGRTQENST